MADVINLNKARKAQAKRDKTAQAVENRVKFGQSKPLRNRAKLDADRTAKNLDGKKLDD
jgi:hypothetical protein